jgi:hypothetical protein
MTDPLSIAASVAGLCTLAESVVHRSRAFVKAARGSEKEIAKLIRSTAQLYGILEQIRFLEKSFDDGFATIYTVRAEQLYECENTLHKLEKILRRSDPSTGSGFMGSTRKKVEWALDGKEVAGILRDIEDHKSTLNLALNATTTWKWERLGIGMRDLAFEVGGNSMKIQT